MSLSFWPPMARRIDALSLRERVCLFLCIAMLMLALADRAVITGNLQQQSRWNAQLAEGAAELSGLRNELARLSGPNAQAQGEVAVLQRALAAAQAERQTLMARLQGGTGTPGVRPADLPSLLGRVLQRHGQVSLVQLGTVAGTAASAVPASGISPRLGAQFSVSGRYADLQRFVAELEASLPGLRWGELQLRSAEPLPVLTVQVWLGGGAP